MNHFHEVSITVTIKAQHKFLCFKNHKMATRIEVGIGYDKYRENRDIYFMRRVAYVILLGSQMRMKSQIY